MVTLKSDNLTDLWAQRLSNFLGWNRRDQNKPLEKKNLPNVGSVENIYTTKINDQEK